MATIAENIQTLKSIKSDIKNAIIQKGGSVTDAFGTYAQAITDLPSGGGNEDLINLIERDITSLSIPDGTTKIGGYVFYNCSSLTSITIKATTPPTLGSSAFDNTNNCPIYVPAKSVNAYKTATNWSAYANRIQAIPTV